MADIDKFVYYENGSKKVLKPTDRIVIGSGGLAFEGATSNDFELQLTVTDPTDDRTINFPDEDGDIALLQGDSLPKALSFPVKNPSTTTALTKGQIVYISGHSGNKPEVSLAQSNSSATMPAFGFVQSDIAAEAEGYVVYSGLFKGIDTNALYNEGDTLYVSSTTAGEFQNTPPSGSNLIQNIGKIVKSDATNGEVLVGGAGRTNATPNLNEGEIFIGNASNQSSKSVYTLPTTDGTSGQVLQTNGSGQLTFATLSSSSSDLVDDTTPQLGGNLDPNGFAIAGHLLPSVINTYNLGASNAEWKYLYLGDSAYIFFGNDSDVYLRHNPDAGLTLSMPSSASGSYEPRFTVSTENGDTNSLGPTIRIQNYSTGATHSGTIEFYGENDGGLIHEYSRIRTQMIDTTTGAEEGRISIYVQGGGNGGAYEGFRVDGISEGCTTIIPRHNGVDEGLVLGSTLVTTTADELNILDTSVEAPSTNDFLMYNGTSLAWDKPEEVIVAELSIPGVDLQTDTNAFRFNCPFGLTVSKLELYLDQHTTSGDVTVTLTNTTDSLSMITLTLGTTTTSGSTTTVSNSSCDAGDALTLAITATPANAQGLRANLFFTRN